jgi:formylglycine-generating enzyme required for sulfatase activity
MMPARRVSSLWVLLSFILSYLTMLLMTSQASGGAIPEIRMTSVKGGCFAMGDQAGDGGFDEKPVHGVCVDDFSLGTYEVTEAQWLAVMGSDAAPRISRGPDYPVSGVSWRQAGEFIKRLNALTGLKYRLPTEAEWEYAARSGGKQQTYAGTSDSKALAEFACGHESCDDTLLPVGSKKPNDLGIYDMSGNAWEWVQDRYDAYYYRQSPRNNPQGDPFGINRVLRGGSSSSTNGQLRTTYREYVAPDIRRDGIGFRLLLPAHQ